jgi:DNA-directed RNA polymerase specialized sigma54-like protein
MYEFGYCFSFSSSFSFKTKESSNYKMALDLRLRQDLRLTQQLILTPQLQMAIKLLQLNQVELVDKITQELAENPALEEGLESVGGEKTLEQTEAKTADSATKEVTIDEKISDDMACYLRKPTFG